MISTQSKRLDKSTRQLQWWKVLPAQHKLQQCFCVSYLYPLVEQSNCVTHIHRQLMLTVLLTCPRGHASFRNFWTASQVSSQHIVSPVSGNIYNWGHFLLSFSNVITNGCPCQQAVPISKWHLVASLVALQKWWIWHLSWVLAFDPRHYPLLHSFAQNVTISR